MVAARVLLCVHASGVLNLRNLGMLSLVYWTVCALLRVFVFSVFFHKISPQYVLIKCSSREITDSGSKVK